MIAKDLTENFGLQVMAGERGMGRRIQGGYCGDLLSDVMANAPLGCVWLTIQGHQNIVAVAVLREMAAIIITGGQKAEEQTLDRADQEDIPIFLSSAPAFDLVGRLYAAGVNNPEAEKARR